MATIRLIGDKSLIRKLHPSRLIAGPAHRWADRSGQALQEATRSRAPRWRGSLAESIDYEIEGGVIPRRVVLKTDAPHAAVHEFGHAPYWPPPRALDAWAAAHGFGPNGGYLVARSISRKGISAKHYMRDGTNAAKPKLIGVVVRFADEIEAGAAI